jgi:hypothetical protein
MSYDNIPAELRVLRQWVVTGPDKQPATPGTLTPASVTDPTTWGSFESAAAHKDKFIGFVFTGNDPYVGIDLDAPVNEVQEAHHKLICREFQTYSEVSMSGKGVHLIAKGSIGGKGRRRERVEVYDQDRYFVFTGKQFGGHPIREQQELLDKLVNGMGDGQDWGSGPIADQPEKHTDRQVFEMAESASNGEKFLQLMDGHWEGEYPSQSEADHALVNMLAFYSRNNEQVRRLFLTSRLGKRDKAMRRDYVDRMLRRIRHEQNPPVDVSAMRNPVKAKAEPRNPDGFRPVEAPTPFPDGLIGECAQYIQDTAIRPVHEVSLVGGLGLMAGIAGRQYNISASGLNLYLMLVAGTGIGKEGAAQGIHRIVRGCRDQLPTIYEFIGPTEYASGQALIRQLSEAPCQLSIMSEFGHTLKRITRPDANSADVMWRKVLLDIFNKSGRNDTLGRMVYSDSGKNTKPIMSPALTLLTESAPSSLYDGMDESSIENGLVPRFLLVECPDLRPEPNPAPFAPPPKQLTSRVTALAHSVMSMQANHKVLDVKASGNAAECLGAFSKEVDDRMNASKNEVLRQVWNRSHFKALRLAGLVAVSRDHNSPRVELDMAEWAVRFARRDATTMTRRFLQGVGMGDSVQVAKLREILTKILSRDRQNKRLAQGVVTHREIMQRTYHLAAFKNDRLGASNATQRALQALMDNGELMRLSGNEANEHFGTRAKCYHVTDEFAGNTEEI